MQPRVFPLCVLALLAGCASLAGKHPTPSTTPVSTTAETAQAALLASYISSLETIVQGGNAEQAEVLASARSAYEHERQGPALLRYALLLAAPAHAARDPQAALKLLYESAAHPELLSPIERALVIVETKQVEQELGLQVENARLVKDALQDRDRQRSAPPDAGLARQLKAVMDDNVRLKKELDEAKSRLEAIATIESNIPARPPGNQGRKP